ncbi:MAG: 4-hydroxyphenylacetate 3-hydroxylase, partial [Alphaproteobacteria bacterium]|nr:4-hydroxyphenylacetate 3-hydroxylase [Alphaproteobacteria bacterium]
VIRGAKFETGAPYAHVACVKPTVGNWVEQNRDYAVSAIVPMDAPGVRHVCRMPLPRGDGHAGEPFAGSPFDRPLSARWDEVDTLIVFDDVLVPWENVLFSRQPKLASLLRADMVRWAPQGYLARCLAKADLLVGAALLVAEQSGTDRIPAIRSKISQLMVFKATVESFLLASEAACETTVSGYVMPNQAIQNAGRVHCSQGYAAMVHLLREIAGGAAVMLPDRRTLESAETRADVEKYFRIGTVDAETRLRTLALVGDLTASGYAGRAQAYQLFAETPVFAQEAALYAAYDRAAAVRRAGAVAGIAGAT